MTRLATIQQRDRDDSPTTFLIAGDEGGLGRFRLPAEQAGARLKWLYPSEWGERVLMRGGGGRVAGQFMPPVWRSTRSR